MKILVIVPAFNEEENIVNVINSIKSENPDLDILIINDSSNDKTEYNAKATGNAMVISLPVNLGIGGAVQTGFKYAQRKNYDIAIKFDGDGQHKADEIPKLLKTLMENDVDVVIGSRFLEKHKGFKSTLSRRVGIKIFQFVNSVLIRQKITDNTSGFIAFNKKSINFLADYYPVDYPEPESVILLNKNRFSIKEVFVEMQIRQGGKSSISGLSSMYYMLKVLLAVFMSAIRKRVIGE